MGSSEQTDPQECRAPQGPGLPIFDTCFSKKKKDKARVKEKELITGPDNGRLRVATRKTRTDPGCHTERASRQSKAEARRIKKEHRWRARRRVEANNNMANMISFTREREGLSTFGQSLSGDVF